jgi:hypothetical protein
MGSKCIWSVRGVNALCVFLAKENDKCGALGVSCEGVDKHGTFLCLFVPPFLMKPLLAVLRRPNSTNTRRGCGVAPTYIRFIPFVALEKIFSRRLGGHATAF